jgi:hypothetical protein
VDNFSPLEIAQHKYKTLCYERYGSDPTEEQSKEVLQELVNAEENWQVKLSFITIWNLCKDYHK